MTMHTSPHQLPRLPEADLWRELPNPQLFRDEGVL